jgi:putative alpha-1,2-mannosidase
MKNIFIQSVTLNGKVWNKPWLKHTEVINGGELQLIMGSVPNKEWGSLPSQAPPSRTD